MMNFFTVRTIGHKVLNAEVSDTTGDTTKNKSWSPKIILIVNCNFSK
jgi:hypothetical protein